MAVAWDSIDVHTESAVYGLVVKNRFGPKRYTFYGYFCNGWVVGLGPVEATKRYLVLLVPGPAGIA